MERKERWHIVIPASIAAKINLLVHDEFTGKPEVGARSLLISRLLARYLDEVERKGNNELRRPA